MVNFKNVEYRSAIVSKPVEEVLEAIKTVVDNNKKYSKIDSINSNGYGYDLVIHSSIFNDKGKIKLDVTLYQKNNDSTQIISKTLHWSKFGAERDSNLSSSLISNVLNELGLKEDLKKFKRETFVKGSKSFGNIIFYEVKSFVKLVIIAVICLFIIGILKAIF